MSLLKKTKTIITHSGTFHPDEVFAIATLEIYLKSQNQKWKIQRTRDPQFFNKADFLVDVGGIHNPKENKFDHHQFGGAGQRQNEVPFASFGLVWKKFGHLISNERIANQLDKELVSPIDALDNGVGEFKPIVSDIVPYTIGHFIRSLNPNWFDGFSQKIQKEKFEEAVDQAKKVLYSEINLKRAQIESEKIIDELYEKTEDKRYLIIDKNYPWNFYVQKFPELLFVIEPAKEGGNFEVKAVKKNRYNFENRKDLPKEWAGLRDQDLQKITGVKDAVFCHNKRFFAVAESLAGAKSLVLKALAN